MVLCCLGKLHASCGSCDSGAESREYGQGIILQTATPASVTRTDLGPTWCRLAAWSPGHFGHIRTGLQRVTTHLRITEAVRSPDPGPTPGWTANSNTAESRAAAVGEVGEAAAAHSSDTVTASREHRWFWYYSEALARYEALWLSHFSTPDQLSCPTRPQASQTMSSNLSARLTAPNGRQYIQPTGLFINNEWVKSSDGGQIRSINPT